mgnify:FL=1
MKTKLRIQLKSDLCAASGEGLGSLIDTDVCYDKYGFPYIPSKRIKGLLRDAFIEYLDWVEDNDKRTKLELLEEKLFGIENANNSCDLKIDNAYLMNVDSLIQDIMVVDDKYKKYLTKERIMSLYTDVRYQTAVDREVGVAKENSLRNIRVVDAGNVFQADLECETEEELAVLQKCVKLVQHMGHNRTRGLGEVVCRLSDVLHTDDAEAEDYSFDLEKEYEIKLLLKAESNLMVSKQFSEISENYIPGSNILGSIANKYIKDHNIHDFNHLSSSYIHLFLDGSVTYSNAYIADVTKDGQMIEYYPAPLSYASVKNQKDVYRNRMLDVVDQNIQLSKFGDKFVTLDECNYVRKVATSEQYHHQRAQDKSFGHVSNTLNGGSFYQFLSINKDQYFITTIHAKGKYLKDIEKYIREGELLRVGKSKTAEYGRLKICARQIKSCCYKEKECHKFAVILTSPMILIDEEKVEVAKGYKTLVSALKKLFQREDLEAVKSFVGYSEESGFNAIWNLPKEQVVSFAAGTTIVFEAKDKVILKDKYILGERRNEGYGQFIIYPLDNIHSSVLTVSEYQEKKDTVLYKDINKESRKLLNKAMKKVIFENIADNAFVMVKKNYRNINVNNTTIGRVLLMLKESNNYAEFYANIRGIKDDEKLENIIKIIENKDNVYMLPAYYDYKEAIESISSTSHVADADNEMFILEYIKQIFTVLKILGGISE